MFKCLKQEDLNKEGSKFSDIIYHVSGCVRIGRIESKESKESKAVLSVLYRIYKSFALVVKDILSPA